MNRQKASFKFFTLVLVLVYLISGFSNLTTVYGIPADGGIHQLNSGNEGNVSSFVYGTEANNSFTPPEPYMDPGILPMAASLPTADTLLVEVTAADPFIASQITDILSGMSLYQKTSVTTIRIEVDAGMLPDLSSIQNLNDDLPNLARLELDFADTASDLSTVPLRYCPWVEEFVCNAKTIPAYMLTNNKKLSVIRLENAETIGTYAFDCKTFGFHLAELYIPRCTSIGAYAFNNYETIGKITIGDLANFNNAFVAGIQFFDTHLTASGAATSFFAQYPKHVFQSVNSVTYFADYDFYWITRSLGSFSTGTPVEILMERTDGTTVTFSLNAGDELPPGLSIDPAGKISGTPTTGGDYEFTLVLQEAGPNSYTQKCSIQITGSSLTIPKVLAVSPAGGQEDVATDGSVAIVFSEAMNPDSPGVVELRWLTNTNTMKGMKIPKQDLSWEDNNTKLVANYSGLQNGIVYWVYVRDFKSEKNMTMTSITETDNYHFRTEYLSIHPQITPTRQRINLGEEAVYQLSLGSGAQKADRAEIVGYGALSLPMLEPLSTTITSDSTIRLDGNKAGLFEFRINFYRTGQSVPFLSAMCYTSVGDFYEISVSADPTGWGTVIGGTDSAPSNREHAVTAIPENGYRFVRWSENGRTVSLNSSYYFYPGANRNLVAHFTVLQDPYQVSVQAVPPEGGTAAGNAELYAGDSHTVTATPAYGYYFINWTEYGQEVSRVQDYSFTIDGDRYLTAHFSTRFPYHIDVFASPADGGTVTGAGTFPEGASHTVAATANPSYQFAGWVENGITISTDSNYTFVVMKDRQLTAQFKSVSSGGGGGGSSARVPVTIQCIDKDGHILRTESATAIAGSRVTINAPEIQGYKLLDSSSVIYMVKSGGNIVTFRYERMEEPEKNPEVPEEIKTIHHAAYITGYPDGTFGPNSSLTRAEAAAMLYNLAGYNDLKAFDAPDFTDIGSDAWYYESIAALASQGIVSGYPDGSYKPNNTITRAEFIALAINFAEMEPLDGTADFSDVDSSHWAAGSIYAAVQNGIIAGYPDGTFKPDAAITRAEVVYILNTITGRINCDILDGRSFSDLDNEHWAYKAILAAATEHVHE